MLIWPVPSSYSLIMETQFEHKSRPLLPKEQYYKRVLRYAGFSLSLITISLGIGVLGYHYTNSLSWLDSLVNASMILTGMGPVDPLVSNKAKWFASFYSIFSGVIFLSTVAVFLSPIFHRFLHKFHLDDEEQRAKQKRERPS
jgi:hypothetical protein